jgi:hypothetical protein
VSDLPQAPPAPIGPIFTEEQAKLPPPEGEVSLDTYNSQYLQRHSASSSAILAAAKVAHTILQAPLEEVESTVFTVFEESAKESFDLKVFSISPYHIPSNVPF